MHYNTYSHREKAQKINNQIQHSKIMAGKLFHRACDLNLSIVTFNFICLDNPSDLADTLID